MVRQLTTLVLVVVTAWAVGEEKEDTSIQRVPWTTSSFRGQPEDPLPYHAERAFGKLVFEGPTVITSMPIGNRFVVVENSGKIFSFPPNQDVERADLFIDLGEVIPGTNAIYGVEFHPKFEENRYVFVCYIQGQGDANVGSVVSRFTVTEDDPPRWDPKSEKQIFRWWRGGHNGGCLKFGHDGYLYLATGDGAGPFPPDSKRTGQDVTDYLSSILRFDVDGEEAGRAYRIPPDNPFVGRDDVRPEIWAYGFRNPWKMSVDPRTGKLWVGDVGWELWEMIYLVERGGNYGWSVTEGPQPVHPDWAVGPTPILPPVVDHPHSEARSITGGVVYTGKRLPELADTYVYADYETGKIWALRHNGESVVSHREIADTPHRIVAFGLASDGELYFADHADGKLYRLAPSPEPRQDENFPRLLSEAGIFASVPELAPNPGVLGYTVNAAPWADHSTGERHIALPDTSQVNNTVQPWRYTEGAVFVKTLGLEMAKGDPASRKRIETQVLHWTEKTWRAYTYGWNDEQTDAELVEAQGAERALVVKDPDAPEGERRQTWRFASRAECLICHNIMANTILGFEPSQLNRGDQLKRFVDLGFFARLPGAPEASKDGSPAEFDARKYPALPDLSVNDGSLDARARAYLHANCSHCHRRHGGGTANIELLYAHEIQQTRMMDAKPLLGGFGLRDARVVVPGDPYRSVLYYRMATAGAARMPHLGSSVLDRDGVKLIHDWIESLGDGKDRLALTAVRNGDEAGIETLIASTSGALRLLRAIADGASGGISEKLRSKSMARALQSKDPGVRDLFRSLVPEDNEVARIGSTVDPNVILALEGDAGRGMELFFQAGATRCSNCHAIGGRGSKIGPELSELRKKYTKPQILESLVDPSKKIDPKFAVYLLITKTGSIHTGLLTKKTEQEVVLTDGAGKTYSVATTDVQALLPQQKSMMPEKLYRDMTQQQVADLIQYLFNGTGEPTSQ